MGYLTLLRKIAYALLGIISRLSGFLCGHTRLHTARFAALHELAGLMETTLTRNASLIQGYPALEARLPSAQPNSAANSETSWLLPQTEGVRGFLRPANY